MLLSLLVIGGCALALYLLLQGAPYVPTRQRDVVVALDLLRLKQGATVVDLGAGDGVVLKYAAQQGYRAVGVEISSLLWLVAWWRLRKINNASVQLANLWQWHLPPETEGVFVFTAGPFVKRLERWLQTEQRRLGRPLKVVSLGFALPGTRPVKKEGACLLYELQ